MNVARGERCWSEERQNSGTWGLQMSEPLYARGRCTSLILVTSDNVASDVKELEE